jgi:hypothetical protein
VQTTLVICITTGYDKQPNPDKQNLQSKREKERESDEDISHGFPLKNIEQDPQAHNYTYQRPMTRAKVKQLQHEVNLFLNDYEHASPKNHVLPNGGTLILLRFESHVKGGLNT